MQNDQNENIAAPKLAFSNADLLSVPIHVNWVFRKRDIIVGNEKKEPIFE